MWLLTSPSLIQGRKGMGINRNITTKYTTPTITPIDSALTGAEGFSKSFPKTPFLMNRSVTSGIVKRVAKKLRIPNIIETMIG